MKSIELFAGAGGLGMGINQAGFKPSAVFEWDKWCCNTLRENHKTWDIREGDVRLHDYSEFEGKVDLVTGGPPCLSLIHI